MALTQWARGKTVKTAHAVCCPQEEMQIKNYKAKQSPGIVIFKKAFCISWGDFDFLRHARPPQRAKFKNDWKWLEKQRDM